MKKKIIHLLCHSIPLREDYIYDGWPARTAKYIRKYSGEYQHECYFAVTGIQQKQILEKDGIKYNLFPAKTLNKALESFFSLVYCPILFSDLKKELLRNNVIIHIQGERGSIVLQAIHTAKGYPIFLQFHGYSTPNILKLFERLFITPLEKYYFQYVNHFFLCMKGSIKYLNENCLISKDKMSLQNLGVDYDIFKPQSKIVIRKKLNLPIDKTIFLYVGRFDDVKGVKEIIDAYVAIKYRYNAFLILIGGDVENKYYKYSQKYADLVIERLEHHRLIDFFNAADAYCMLCSPEKAKSAGMGVAPCEALSCDKPILSSNLFEAPENIQKKIGIQIYNKKDLIKAMIFLTKNNSFKNIRSITEPYYSWKILVQNILIKYHGDEIIHPQ